MHDCTIKCCQNWCRAFILVAKFRTLTLNHHCEFVKGKISLFTKDLRYLKFFQIFILYQGS